MSKVSARSVGARHQSRRRKIQRIYSIIKRLALVLFALGSLGAIILAGMVYYYSHQIPNVDEINKFIPPETTKIYSADGVILAELHREENRILTRLERISPILQQSVVALEDANFYHHHGIDFKGIFRALFVNIREGRFAQGGSTLTQQLAKNLFLTRDRHLIRKLKEAILAIQIERKYSKTEILEMYLNQVYWGHNAYGIESASRMYFGKTSSDLNLAESAMLVGILKGPEYYSPFRHFDRAKQRQKITLNRMVDLGFVSQSQADNVYVEDLSLVERERLRYKAPYFTMYVISQLIEMFGEETTYTSGMQVYTTLDYRLQQHAENVVDKYVELAKKPNWVGGQRVPSLNYRQASILSMDPRNGYIKAMQGGSDFLDNEFNRTVQALRQPGSAFKPFVYLAALEKGLSPGTFISDTPVTFNTIEGPYSPNNYTRKFSGWLPMRRALELSVNVVSIKLNDLIGPKKVVDVAKRIGISSPLKPVLSLPLGANEVTMLELLTAYGVFANDGRRVEPTAIVKIEDRDGIPLYNHQPRERKVFDSNLIAALVDMMKGIPNYGTGRNAKLPRPMAGKTGTTSDYKDAWFFGFVPQMVTATWVGNDNNQPMNKVAGGGIPALMWKDFMKTALDKVPARDFRRPRGLVTKSMDWDTQNISTQFSPEDRVTNEKYWRDRDLLKVGSATGTASSDETGNEELIDLFNL